MPDGVDPASNAMYTGPGDAPPPHPETEPYQVNFETGARPQAFGGTPAGSDVPPLSGASRAVPSSPQPASEMPPGPAETSFRSLARIGLLAALVLMALQTCLGLDLRSLWFSDEVRHAAVYQAMQESGEWLLLSLNGMPYPDKPPLYFWFLHALDQLPGIDPPMLFLFATAVSALLFMAAAWLLARGLGHDRSIAFAATLILLSTFSFIGITHYARMDLLFAASIVLSHVCLYRGWIKPSAYVWLALGFLLAGVACLIKGPLGLAFPLLSSLLFLGWRGSFRRAGGRDGAFGFALMLILLLTWIGLVLFQEGGKEYLGSMFGRHTLDRVLDAWHHKQPWWFYAAALPLAWLPWTLILPFLPWERLPALLRGCAASRMAAPGHGWTWISLLSGFALLTALSGKVGIYLLPLYPFLAILTARGLLSMGPRRSRMFFWLLALLFLLLAVGIGLAGAYPYLKDSLPEFLEPGTYLDLTRPGVAALMDYVMTLKGLPVLAGVCLITALLLAKGIRKEYPGGGLLVTALCCTVLAQPLALMTAPSLETLMSPKPQADIMREYAAGGYHVCAFSVTAGTYTYDMGGPVDEINSWEQLGERLAAFPRIVVATRMNRWKEWQERPDLQPEAFRVINVQRIAERNYVVLVRDGEADLAAEPRDAQDPERARPGADPENRSDPDPAVPDVEATEPDAVPEGLPETLPDPALPEEPDKSEGPEEPEALEGADDIEEPGQTPDIPEAEEKTVEPEPEAPVQPQPRIRERPSRRELPPVTRF